MPIFAIPKYTNLELGATVEIPQEKDGSTSSKVGLRNQGRGRE